MVTRGPGKKPREETTALVKKDSEEDVADEKLVEQTVEWIRAKMTETVFRGMTEIGEYVFQKFFGGDPERVRSRKPDKSASFRSLVERCEAGDLPLRKSALHNAVGIAVMRRLLPEDDAAFKQLPPTHQATLLPLKDPAKVEKVAQRAVTRELTVRDLKEIVTEEVAKNAPEDERRGRPKKPVILKTLDRSLKVFNVESGSRSFTKAHFDELSDDETKAALKSAKALLASLNKLIEKLGERV